MSEHDFDALRAERNRKFYELMDRISVELGTPVESLRFHFNPQACYCGCTAGGPCEHVWDGEVVTVANITSATCSRCGDAAYSHDMRVMP